MFGTIKRKTLLMVGFLAILLSSITNIFVSPANVEASTAVYEQTYVELTNISRVDDELYVTLKDKLLVKNMTYEYTHYVDDVLESDIVTEAPRQLSPTEYVIDLPSGTVGVKVWKVMHQVEADYYKNKYTEGPNSVGDLSSVKKKNYITVTSDKLVAYEYSTQNFNLPWYMWSPVGLYLTVGDYLFREETSASYTWYFNIDREIDEIIDVDITYATFEYSEILWGTIESKHDYKTHGPMKITAEQQVFDYARFIEFAENECGLDFAGGTCNNKLKEQTEEYFKKSAVGASSYVDNEGNSYDWYVQVTLDDLLKENNILWGAVENKEYLQEVTLLNISYYFEGQEYFDVSVLDEDTGEANIIPDPSPIDLFVNFIDDVFDWAGNAIEWLKNHSWIIWTVLAIIIFLLIVWLWRIVKPILMLVWFILKWTILLPGTITYYVIKKKQTEKKKQKDFEKLMANHKKNTNYKGKKL